jgi:hypothetical protein
MRANENLLLNNLSIFIKVRDQHRGSLNGVV